MLFVLVFHAHTDLSVFKDEATDPQPNMLRQTLFFNELNLLLPVFLYFGIYSGSGLEREDFNLSRRNPDGHEKRRRIVQIGLLLLRLTATWTSIIFFSLAWYLSKTYLVVIAVLSLAAGLVLADMEYHILSTNDCKHLKLNTSAGAVLFFGMSCLPVNFFLNVIGMRNTLGQIVYAQLLSFLRIGLTLAAVFTQIVYNDYRLAWSCYMELPIKDYTKGYCPAYTNDYFDNFACRNAEPNNLACEGGVLPSWKSPHLTVHICCNLVAALYAQHAINVWITWVRQLHKK